ncbi:uncharacterized protein LOC142174569 [Nicotiana tabacum]|uniref:Uncharacterized protein LOC142174569 n=1 Tax=Nicotiana tabacum TaxID=4097 RepID=A0AC58TH09_TOBAC
MQESPIEPDRARNVSVPQERVSQWQKPRNNALMLNDISVPISPQRFTGIERTPPPRLKPKSKKVLVNPEDDKDRRWYIRYVAVPTVDLIGETNIPFPEKWNFEPTMGDVEPIPNFRGWVDSLLKIVTREQRTWKSISSLHGWKVKTHGFGIRGMTAEVAMAIRMSANAALDLDKARALLPKRKATKESSEEEEEGTSLITRPRARRRIIIDNEIENTPARTSATEPVLI